MAQYTNTSTSSGGSVVNTVLDTETNILTITATTPSGTVATTSLDANGDIIDAVVSLRNQWSANEPTLSRTELSSGIRNAVLSTVNNVKSQSASATAVSVATGVPPPAESQAIPVNPTTNPAVPQPQANPDTENPAPQKEPADEFGGLDEAVERQRQESEIAAANRTPEDINLENERVAAFDEESRAQAQIDYEDAPPVTEEDFNTGNQTDENQSAAETARLNNLANAGGTARSVNAARTTAVEATQRQAKQQSDWRVRLSLAPNANYLYNTAKQGDILYPLLATKGVIFPYTPTITMNYRANYDPADLTHTNYKQYFYKNSSVDDVSITADFTAQDTNEALYMLAVIHFFRSVTKMFYGRDQNPRAGTPPPLCYLVGYGQYQFSDHPLLINSFQYSLPNEVDYIRAGSTTQWAGASLASYRNKSNTTGNGLLSLIQSRLGNTPRGGITPEPKFADLSNSDATYVPTKIQITLGAYPVVTRNDIANNFSLEDYASGKLFKRGIW